MTRLNPAKDEPTLRTVWGEVVLEHDLNWAITNGFLLPPYGVTVPLPDLDVDSLHVGDGDITDDAASEAMMKKATLNATVAAVVERTENLATIVFGASMEHCRAVALELNCFGVTAEVVVGTTSVRERKGIYRRFHSGETRVIVTVDVLTEGADFPCCEAVVLARPTRSQSRLVQCVGRGLRPHTFTDGRVKKRALVVDLVGAGQMGLIVDTKLDKRHKSTGAVYGCQCKQPCAGPCAAGTNCTGLDCGCSCDCGNAGDNADKSAPPCTCNCSALFDICRCGCVCDVHRIDPLEDFDPVTGDLLTGKAHRGDSPWSARTETTRWARHPRGLVRPVYRSDGSKGVLMLADMRGVENTTPGRDWAFGFFDSTVRRMFWVGVTGEWLEPGPQCYLQGMSLKDADALAQRIFPGHMRDSDRGDASPAQVNLAAALNVPDADTLDRRDLSDMIALAQAEKWLPFFPRSAQKSDS